MTKRNSGLTRRDLIRNTVAAGGLALTGVPALSIAQQSAGASTVGPTPYGDLAEQLSGSLIMPGNDEYDSSRKIFNDMIDNHPAAIARCRGAADVMDVVNYSREHDIPVTVRGGGHSVAGKAVKDGAITIDLGPMHGVRADPVARRARAQGGVRLRGLDRETLAIDMVTPSGTVSDTGIAGLTLGGGFGFLQRKHGLTIDNLVSADVVTADGKLLIASESQNPDLFWALRGGGGNFGVVTSFEYQMHDLEPTIAGLTAYMIDDLKDVLHFYREYTSNAPDSVMTMAGAFPGIPGTPTEGSLAAFIVVCHSGPLADGERVVKPVKDFGSPVLDTVGPMAFSAVQTMFDAGSPPRMRHYWRSEFVRELSDDLIDTMVDIAPDLPRPGSMLLLEHMGGAIGRVGPLDTAFSHRDAQYNASILSSWKDADSDASNADWTRSAGNKLRAFGTGGAYINYMSEEGDAVDKAVYDLNMERLIEVKRKYDPTNMFSANRSIAP